MEWSQRDELFDYYPKLTEQVTRMTGQHAFNVARYTAGYTRDIGGYRNLQAGIGANLTAYTIDSVLKPFYGGHPWGVNVFIRFRLKPGRYRALQNSFYLIHRAGHHKYPSGSLTMADRDP